PAAPDSPAPCEAAASEPGVAFAPEVLKALRATPAPWYVVAYPATGGGWHISLLQAGGVVRDSFMVTDLDAADHALQDRGYLSLASAMGRDWDRLTPRRNEHGRGTPVFLDPGEDA
ncbi:hypothetical protein, partial [Streptomyces sp. OspMP-M43]|uniref:hypothetical protein n=1 Tax=Streptomyces sp. OspMP-M43 TaxID=1839781 RepID=UPI00081B9AC5